MKLILFLLCSVLAHGAIAASPTIIPVGEFSNKKLSGWEDHVFDGITQYSLGSDGESPILEAHSFRSASGLIKKIEIDLHKTPFLNWRWKVNHALYNVNELEKKGDDYAARIYIVVDGGMLFWRTLALNYVWASQQEFNNVWENAFTSNVKMIAVQSGDKYKKQWRNEKRNVREDLQKAFGRDFRFIDAVAIMTDTDNSQQKATAYYGDIYFSEQ